MNTQARIKREGKNFEILIDLDEALKVRKGVGGINKAVLTNDIFYNLKSGEKASEDDLRKVFGTIVFEEVAEKIIKTGEIVMPSEYLKNENEQKYKKIVDFLSKNAVDNNGKSYTPNRIMNALQEANVQVKNKEIDSQISDILQQIQKIIPIKIETKRIRVTIPAIHIGKAYGIINEFKESEEWLSNGDLQAILGVPAGLIMEFYDKLNAVTHGSALSEDLK